LLHLPYVTGADRSPTCPRMAMSSGQRRADALVLFGGRPTTIGPRSDNSKLRCFRRGQTRCALISATRRTYNGRQFEYEQPPLTFSRARAEKCRVLCANTAEAPSRANELRGLNAVAEVSAPATVSSARRRLQQS
jgi:hypothetical protein